MKRFVHCYYREHENGEVVKVCLLTNALRIGKLAGRPRASWSLETGECVERSTIKTCRPAWIDDPLIRQIKAKQSGKLREEIESPAS